MIERQPPRFTDDVSLVLCGEAGQGIQTVEHILTQVLKRSGYHVFSTQEYMSRIRGGSNSTAIRVSRRRICAPLDRIDLLIPFGKGAVRHVEKRISTETVLLGERLFFGDEYQGDRGIDVPLSEKAMEVGGPIYLNTVAVGLLSGLFKIEKEILREYLKRHFSGKSGDVIHKNIEAAEKGFAIGLDGLGKGWIDIDLQRDPRVEGEMIFDGVEALAAGAIAGGCQFVPFYPMSPSTGVAVSLSQRAKEFGLIVEQVEDEISAINMMIGAWYGGARAMATTSGGGFALMTEGVSLAGMLESPAVIHIAQRPAPATGLPTRTEQGDLFLALYAGHGEFPRIIFAPGTIEETFDLTRRAFDLADRFQVPVFILTDQYLLESHYNIPSLDLGYEPQKRYVVETGPGYRRYRLTEDGVSPRGIPGFGEGLVVLDSDEHDEEGHITEDLDLRVRMVEKRLKKLNLIRNEILPPGFLGPPNFKTLIIGWGSNYHVLKEAIERLGREDVAFLHFKQVYPLNPDIGRYLQQARTTVLFENNATSQFSQLIRLQTGFDIEHRILKFNGLPFTVEEVQTHLERLLN
jgi:2-oxoglutarate ferredoxin oxidoreductase subunit alpha